MRPWLYHMLITGKVAHPGICDRCNGEMHGQCLLAYKTYLHSCPCKCRRGACRKFKYGNPAFSSRGRKK